MSKTNNTNNPRSVRFATFNVALFRSREGELIDDLSTPDNPQIQKLAEIIQRVRPAVLLVNEFDYDEDGQAAALFQQNYLSVPHNGAQPIDYPFTFLAPSNTGVLSGIDQDGDGLIALPEDGFGFGEFPGQYAMLVLSQHPIDVTNGRTFQRFLWNDMPEALLPINPESGESYYSPEALAKLRLSSKSHWDLPLSIGKTTIHFLVSHPTPPVYDGPEDRNRLRNHDEIRFWADYIQSENSGYIYDDNGVFGGLAAGQLFVIAGDQNADPCHGASMPNSIQRLLDSPLVNTTVTPASEGGLELARLRDSSGHQGNGDPRHDTVDLPRRDGRGNLRIDYVLPSHSLEIADAGVFWPTTDSPHYELVGRYDPDLPSPHFPSSDHRLVWVDLLV